MYCANWIVFDVVSWTVLFIVLYYALCCECSSFITDNTLTLNHVFWHVVLDYIFIVCADEHYASCLSKYYHTPIHMNTDLSCYLSTTLNLSTDLHIGLFLPICCPQPAYCDILTNFLSLLTST